MGKNKKILLVNRDFQLRYTKAAISVAVISTVLSASVILYPLYIFEILRIPKFLPLPILGAMVAAVFINVGMIAFLGVLLTHRLAGPIYSITREFRKISEGLWGLQMKIRPEDDLKYLVRSFNEMSERLEVICAEDIRKLDSIEEKFTSDKTDEKLGEQGLEELRSLRNCLKTRILKQSKNT